MVEVQHNLIARRQKLRERIEYNTKNILNMRKEVEEIAASQKQMVPELKEIIDSIDSLSKTGYFSYARKNKICIFCK